MVSIDSGSSCGLRVFLELSGRIWQVGLWGEDSDSWTKVGSSATPSHGPSLEKAEAYEPRNLNRKTANSSSGNLNVFCDYET